MALSALDGDGQRIATRLVCDRVYFAAERGLCLTTTAPSRFGDLVVGRSKGRAGGRQRLTAEVISKGLSPAVVRN